MPWGRVDDSMYDHPKVEALPTKIRNACVGLWFRAISWSNRHSTDGVISLERLRKLDGDQTTAEALVAVGLFDLDDAGRFRVHDFLDFNASAADVRRRREAMRQLGHVGGKRSGEARRFRSGSSATLHDDRSASLKPERSASLAPRLNSRPDPSYTRPIERTSVRSSARATVADDEAGYDQVVQWLASRKAWVDSPKIATDLARLIDRSDVAAVLGALEAEHAAGMRETAQLVYGARNRLFPLPGSRTAEAPEPSRERVAEVLAAKRAAREAGRDA